MFSCEFCQISKNTFFTEHLWTTASRNFEIKALRQMHEGNKELIKESRDLKIRIRILKSESFKNFVT